MNINTLRREYSEKINKERYLRNKQDNFETRTIACRRGGRKGRRYTKI